MKLIVPTRNTRFLPNLTLDWLTTAIRSTRGARRTFHSANLQESTTPCSIHGVSGNSPLISWAWVGWGRLCLKGTTYILLSRPNHHQGYKLTETLCFRLFITTAWATLTHAATWSFTRCLSRWKQSVSVSLYPWWWFYYSLFPRWPMANKEDNMIQISPESYKISLASKETNTLQGMGSRWGTVWATTGAYGW